MGSSTKYKPCCCHDRLSIAFASIALVMATSILQALLKLRILSVVILSFSTEPADLTGVWRGPARLWVRASAWQMGVYISSPTSTNPT